MENRELLTGANRAQFTMRFDPNRNGGQGDENVDERLKGLDPKLIELVMNEVRRLCVLERKCGYVRVAVSDTSCLRVLFCEKVSTTVRPPGPQWCKASSPGVTAWCIRWGGWRGVGCWVGEEGRGRHT